MKNEMYIYLVKRDKSGVKFIGSFSYPSKVYPTKIDENNIKLLNMNPQTTAKILKSLKENKMDHELFFETAESFEKLKSSLLKRGYSRIPNHQFFTGLKKGLINEKVFVTKKSTMIRKGSSSKWAALPRLVFWQPVYKYFFD